jgi:S-adenosylmethionine decarboxylase
MRGREWIIDAHGCDPSALRDLARLGILFDRLTADLRLTPVGDPVWHTFPAPGGITGFVVLAESHLACHTFPEFGSICVNVFCCRPRTDIDVARLMADVLGAAHTLVRSVERAYAPSLEAET